MTDINARCPNCGQLYALCECTRPRRADALPAGDLVREGIKLLSVGPCEDVEHEAWLDRAEMEGARRLQVGAR